MAMLERLLRVIEGEPLNSSEQADVDDLAAWDEANPPSEKIWESLRSRILVATAERIEDPEGEHEPVLVNRFELDDVLGEGGMGIVFLAWDRQLERNVALKLWKSKRPGVREALAAEAMTLAKLNHPNVVTIHEAGAFEDHVYFVMEYIDGHDVDSWLRTGDPEMPPVNWLTVVEVFAAAGRGLAAAHDAHVMHNDFKPANILIGVDHRVKVADFGLAELIFGLGEDDEERYRPGTVIYMAPERLAGRRGDARADQYSFCASMYRVLYGAPPYAGESRVELRNSIEAGELQVGKRVLPKIPRRLRSVVIKGLAPKPEERHEDMHTLVRALTDVPESIQRRKWVGAVSGLMTLCCTLAVVSVVLALRPTFSVTSSAKPIAENAEPVEADGPPSIDAVLESVEEDQFAEAIDSWRQWHNQRQLLGQPTVTDSLRLGELLLAKAEALKIERPKKAREAVSHAAEVGYSAQAELIELQLPTTSADQLISQAEILASELKD